MRLLKLNNGGQISLAGDFINDVPPYAILSHTWGSDDDEVTFNDLINGTGDNKKGYAKIRFCAEQARKNGLEYSWVDTCCINKTHGPELQEAITSMFRWYRRADQCYVYLSDVSVDSERRWKAALRKSKWFTRGWTLQELIAPNVVEFFSREGELLGSKNSLKELIHEITQIPIKALCGGHLSDFSVNERLRWAENRETKKQEDRAYCLMGLFDVFMPLMYGEGDNALIRLKKEINNISPNELDEATMKSLNDLKITDPLEDMTMIELSKDHLLEDCYKWILRDANFQAWRRTDAVPLLWINGDPGKGKTMLMIALARELSNDVGDNSSVTTYFFCQNTDPRLNNAVSILRGLIWKLAMDHPRLAMHIHNKSKVDKQLLSGPNPVVSLFSVLSSMLDDCPRTFLLIDALDECNPGAERDQLLSMIIKDSKSLSKAKWLITSRNYPDIKLHMESESRMLSLELNEEHISHAVAVFIEQKTSELARTKKYSPDLKEKVKKALTVKADSTFLWVALACKSLLNIKVTRRGTLSALENLPAGLEALYARMMEHVFQGDYENEDRVFCIQILCAVSLALRPLSQEELMVIADLPRELLEHDGLSELVERCGSFIFIRKHTLRFIHQSAKDYLVGRGAQKLFPASFQHEHGLIVDRSLDAMSNTLRRNMCNLKHPGSPASETELLPCLSAINYACSFWVEHLINYLTDPPNNLCLEKYLTDGGRIYTFLLQHLLHWFEALSAVGQIDRGILGLHTLEQVIGRATSHLQPGSTLKHGNVVHDGLRVFRQFRPALEEAPLQVYHSALIFSPENSIIRIQFKDESLTGYLLIHGFVKSGAHACRRSKAIPTGSGPWSTRRTAGSWRRARATTRCGSGTRPREPPSTRSRAIPPRSAPWSTRRTAGSWRRARATTRCGSGTRPRGPPSTRSRAIPTRLHSAQMA
jgi:NACHT domain/Heterokaryon incompatibility protein (HET)